MPDAKIVNRILDRGGNDGLHYEEQYVHGSACFVQLNRHLIGQGEMDDEGFDDFAQDDEKQYLYMELESTANFKGFDIDKMMEHTSINDFMKQIYSTGATKKAGELSKLQEAGKLAGKSSLDIITQIMESGSADADKEQDDQEGLPRLVFDQDAV